jgi:hypothetical protein
MSRAALLVLGLSGCVGAADIDADSQAVEYEKPFNTITIVKPGDGLLRGYHMAFDTFARKTCVTAKPGAKISVESGGEDFALEYKDVKRELRSFFNMRAEAKADVVLIHAKAKASLEESLSKDSFGLQFGLHAYQYFQLSYDSKDLDLTDEAKKRLENAAQRPLGTVAREHLLHCGPGYVRAVRVGGQLDVAMEVTGSSYAKTAQIKKSVEVGGILGKKEWHEDKTITDKMADTNVSVTVFARGFSFEGGPISDARATAYLRGKIDAAVAARQNPVVAAVQGMKDLHNALKKSVSDDQRVGAACKESQVFQAVLGNYLDLDDAPTTCGGKPMLQVRAQVNEIADKMARFAIGFLTAEAAAFRALTEMRAFFAYFRDSRVPLITGYGWETDWHADPVSYTWTAEVDFQDWLLPYAGWTPGANAELDPNNAKGVRRVAWDYYTSVRDKLSAGPEELAIVDAATVDHKKLKEWRMLVEDPRNFVDDSWKTRTYWWKKPTFLRNLFTYRKMDRLRPTYVVKHDKDVAGTALLDGSKKCDAAANQRFLNEAERYAIAPWVDLGNNHTRYAKGARLWMDPAIGACKAGTHSYCSQQVMPPPPPRPAGPIEYMGVTPWGCLDVKQSADLLCVPAEGGIFGGDNPFEV